MKLNVHPRTLAVFVSLALGTLLAPTAPAADKELLDILLANGAINAEQHAELSKKAELTRKDVENVVVTLDKRA
jgi:hypothetical protein